MNLAVMLEEDETMTVRQLINKTQHMALKSGLVKIGQANKTSDLWGFRDEIIAWDDEGNTLMFYYVNGMGFKTVNLRKKHRPGSGVILASLKETQRIEYFPDYDAAQDEDNNSLYFYRSDHPDAAPFLSLCPMWLLLPEFHDLLSAFPEGDYSALDGITEVLEPHTGLSMLVPQRNKYSKAVVFPDYFEDRIA